jgi:hypothetical protein
VRQTLHLAATEGLTRLTSAYEAAALAFDGAGDVEAKAQAVKEARFRLEAYAAYLAEQKERL